jgi:hypothetical protein
VAGTGTVKRASRAALKILRPNALPQDQVDWVVEIKQEMQELRRRIQELERKAKDR